MKYLTLILTLSILMTACQTNNSQADIQATDSMQVFKSIINGIWYEPTYITDIQKTKSPYKSQNELASMVELDIDISQIQGDSILEVGAPSIHEGTSFMVFFRPGLTPTSLPTSIQDYDNQTNFYELGYEISNGDTSLNILHYDKNKMLFGKSKYLRVPKNSEGGLQYMVNKTLFAGSYTTVDSIGQKLNLQFSNDGHLTGLPNFKKYYVLTDFVAGPENNLDEVCFDIQTPNQKCYAYEIKGDTINLYEAKENDEHITLELGQLKFKLVKQ